MLILTHENADFDAIASLLGAHKLFPSATPLLPRRINRNVSQFLTLYWDVLPFVRPDDWKKQRIHEIVLVDTHSVSSVRGVVRSPQVQVIDHHTGHKQNETWTYRVEAVGATVTILVEMMQTAGLSLTPEEATLLLLGIHEDTGSLTYMTTTPRDVRAAAWLLEQGAQLTVVRRFLNVALTATQRKLFDQLQAGAEWLTINGQAVVIASAVAEPDFDDEISSVAHRLRDVLSAAGLFVLVQLGNDVQLVARSANQYIDVSVVAKGLGGGGHDRASAALIVGESLTAVTTRLKAMLPSAIKPAVTVAQLMSYGVQTLPVDATAAEAIEQMQRYGYEGYPVVDEAGQIVGLLTRRAVDRAMGHDLKRLPVGRIMKVGSVTVQPTDSIERVQGLMMAEGWGQIPVMDDGDPPRLLGIVTRTDLLNQLFKTPLETAVPDMRLLLQQALPPEMWQMVVVVGETAAELQMPLYFVGGLVRDVLLGHSATDLDMVVEGDAIKLVKTLQAQFGGEVRTHARFGTAKWLTTPAIWQAIFPADAPLETASPAHLLLETIDFVTARTEFYTQPSALPEVTRGSIKLDLHRRDFTINTLAVRLDGAHLGELLDFYSGLRDLEKKLIRVLHSLSFIDDPTRILRAVRLEQRLGFALETRTAELVTAALPMLDRVTGERIRNEIELALREAVPEKIMERLAELDVLTQIEPAWHWSTAVAEAFQLVRSFDGAQWRATYASTAQVFLYFAVWLVTLPDEAREKVMTRLKVRKATRDDIESAVRALAILTDLPLTARPSEVERALRPFLPRTLLVARLCVQDGAQADRLDVYYAEWRDVKTAVTGEDIRASGLPPGPEYALILDAILAARLDGRIHTETEERALLAQLVSEHTPA